MDPWADAEVVLDPDLPYRAESGFSLGGAVLKRGDIFIPSEHGMSAQRLHEFTASRMAVPAFARSSPIDDSDDSQLVPFRGTPGETVSVEPPYRHGKRKGKRRG